MSTTAQLTRARAWLARIVCWLRGHDREVVRVGRGKLAARVARCRRCGGTLQMTLKRMERMTVPRGGKR